MSAHRQRKGIVLVALALAASLLGSCSGSDKAPVRVGALKGPTGMGIVGLMDKSEQGKALNEYVFTLEGAPDAITGKLVSGELDIAALPLNVASVLYNKTDKQIQMLAVNTLGVLYIVTKGEELGSIADLKDKTVYATGAGATPEYTLNYLLTQNGLTPGTDVTVEYKSEHAELAALMSAGQATIALLPQPFVTTVMAKDDTIKVALDLTEEWEKVSQGTQVVTGCIVVRKEYLEKNKTAVDNFLKEYKESTEFVNASVDEAAALIGKYDIVPEAVAKKAIPDCNIVYLDKEEMVQSAGAMLEVFHAANPQSVGGVLPDDAFYYKP